MNAAAPRLSQHALDNGGLAFPAPYVDFSQCDDVPFDRVSVLEAPHRIADAIFRDSTLDGVGFRLTEIGKRIFRSSPINATEAFKYAPTSLLFGVWDSTGPRGGCGSCDFPALRKTPKFRLEPRSPHWGFSTFA